MTGYELEDWKDMAEILFDRNRLARASDPATSKSSSEDILNDEGWPRYMIKRGKRRHAALGRVALMEGWTAREMEEQYNDNDMHKRLSELVQDGYIERGDSRPCRVTGKKSYTWKIIDKGREKLEELA